MVVTSPAKLNLCLYVVGREPGGYHRLVTLFHRISLRDTLHLKKIKTGFSLKCPGVRLSTGEDNLITCAYRLLQEKFPRLGGVRVRLVKKIPLGGGLGGGSSNAACFLLAMKKLYRLKLSAGTLERLGRRLGADVPFFLRNVNQAVGTGRGDRIRVRLSGRRHYFVLVLDKQGLSTKKVYQNMPRRLPSRSLTKAGHAVRILCTFLDRGDIKQAAACLHNDLETAAFRLRPSIQKTIENLAKGQCRTARMSGSGPTVFAILGTRKEAAGLAARLRHLQSSKRVVVCHSF